MATHSSILAWGIPWTEKPGGQQSIGSQRVGHDWSKLARMTPPYGRMWKRTKEPLDENERGEWKSWLKALHSEN